MSNEIISGKTKRFLTSDEREGIMIKGRWGFSTLKDRHRSALQNQATGIAFGG
jgi:hypothetical protein